LSARALVSVAGHSPLRVGGHAFTVQKRVGKGAIYAGAGIHCMWQVSSHSVFRGGRGCLWPCRSCRMDVHEHSLHALCGFGGATSIVYTLRRKGRCLRWFVVIVMGADRLFRLFVGEAYAGSLLDLPLTLGAF